MTDGIMLGPGEGRRIVGGALDATVKSTISSPALTSSFEMVIPPGYDVGAHVHAHGEEVFYVIEGELDLLAFEPLDRGQPDWHEWESLSGGATCTAGLARSCSCRRTRPTRSPTPLAGR